MNENLKFMTEYLHKDKIAFPLGGLGSGMFAIDGSGSFSNFSLFHHPNIHNKPCFFAAISFDGMKEREGVVLEGANPKWRIFGEENSGFGKGLDQMGLRRFRENKFYAAFPFANVKLYDKDIPFEVLIDTYSPFVPRDEDLTSLPMVSISYKIKNTSKKSLDITFSFNSENFMKSEGGLNGIRGKKDGFVLFNKENSDKPYKQGEFYVTLKDNEVYGNPVWYRGGWFDSLSCAWSDILTNKWIDNKMPCESFLDSPGASIFKPLHIEPNKEKTVTIITTWFVPYSNLSLGDEDKDEASINSSPDSFFMPWYKGAFESGSKLNDYCIKNETTFRKRSLLFAKTLAMSDLPPEIINAVQANLSILHSPTLLRTRDGRLYGFEGSGDIHGSCYGNCTHVYNYAQAIAYLFPGLDRTILQTEYCENLSEDGKQAFRAKLPIRRANFDVIAAADGQLGSIIRVFRHWKITGDKSWLEKILPKVIKSIEYSIKTWDPNHKGVLDEPQHNTYDIEFWGPNGMISSIYSQALMAIIEMLKVFDKPFEKYKKLYEKVKNTYMKIFSMENTLYKKLNGRIKKLKILWNFRA